jgi:hypothetical protein
MGRPEYLTSKDVEQLQQSSLLVRERQPLAYEDRAIFFKTELPPHAVAAITISFVPEQS